VRLAVLIPAYNAAAELQRTLASLARDPAPFDVVVVDDGSDVRVPGTTRAGCHRVIVLRRPVNGGVAAALNTGLEWILARDYEFIARLDAGDVNDAARFARQSAFLDHHPDVAIVGSWTRHVDEDHRELYITRYPAAWEDILRCFHFRAAFSHPACMLRVASLRAIGAYDDRFTLAEDYELFWRLARRFPCANIPDVLVSRLESSRSLTSRRRIEMARLRLLLQWRHFGWTHGAAWLGLARSLGLLLVPGRAVLRLKRIVGVVG
jgi:glycosyltransferase involved in cell wall biosynthesis